MTAGDGRVFQRKWVDELNIDHGSVLETVKASLAGRIRAVRTHGKKLTFLTISIDCTEDEDSGAQTETLQLVLLPNRIRGASSAIVGELCRKEAHIQCTGPLGRTKLGELSLFVEDVSLLQCSPEVPAVEYLVEHACAGDASGTFDFERAISQLTCRRADLERLRLLRAEFITKANDLAANACAADVARCDTQLSKNEQKRRAKLERRNRHRSQCGHTDASTPKSDIAWLQAGEAKRLIVRIARVLRGLPPYRVRHRLHRLTAAERSALTWAYEQEWMLPLDEVTDLSDMDLGPVRPLLNLTECPHTGAQTDRVDDETRRELYCVYKKEPQVRWMVHQVHRWLRSVSDTKSNRPTPAHIIDVGGGRGDLALALAYAFGDSVRVSVVDVNEASLAAGNSRGETLELQNVAFHCVDVTTISVSDEDDTHKVASAKPVFCRATPEQPVLVVALHACGGLSDAALRLASDLHGDFLVCTCCFCHNEALYYTAAEDENTALTLQRRKTLSRLAESISARELNVEAMRVVNCWRLYCASHHSESHDADRLCVLSFSEEFSPRNQVLCSFASPVSEAPTPATPP